MKILKILGLIIIVICITIEIALIYTIFIRMEETIGTITHITLHRYINSEQHWRAENWADVSYYVDGKEYESHITLSVGKNWIEGDKIKIYYYKDKPQYCDKKNELLLLLIYPIIGVIFGIYLLKIAEKLNVNE